MVRLIKPSAKYKETYLLAERELQKEGRHKEFKLDELRKNFSKFIRKLKDDEKGKKLPKGYVPVSTFWLIADEEFIGFLTIRHRLNKNLKRLGGNVGYVIRPSKRNKGYGTEILRLGLLKAKMRGLEKVLVTCDDDNIGSWKIIEANGGILQRKLKYKGKLIRHYWIKIK